MTDTILPKDWLKNNGKKLKTAYSYAVINKLNVDSKDDMATILQATDPENINKKQIEIYSKMLQLFRERFRRTVGKVLEE